jgi:hypothetical protein
VVVIVGVGDRGGGGVWCLMFGVGGVAMKETCNEQAFH